ncbi:MAG TPA: hypothetical protein VKE93_02190 [Candidatus Angelobacter sp.]|nr:hypothetical protein [Candidatus Angelobacter sp.]
MQHRWHVSFLALVLFGSTALGRAATTMTLNYKAFPSNADLLYVGTFHPKGDIKLSAPEHFYAKDGTTYEFLFWDVDGTREIRRNVTFTPKDSTTVVTAWYLLEGGGSCTSTDPCKCSGVTTYAFALNQHKVIPNTPIASVTPNKDWTGPPSTSVVTCHGPVHIAALPDISGFGNFEHWQELPKRPLPGAAFNVPVDGSVLAVAFYGHPEPDPCQSLREQISNFICDTPATPKGCQLALTTLKLQLNACEQKNGEATTLPAQPRNRR